MGRAVPMTLFSATPPARDEKRTELARAGSDLAARNKIKISMSACPLLSEDINIHGGVTVSLHRA